MSVLTLNWIKFFHNSNIPFNSMQKVFDYISGLSPETFISMNEMNSYLLASGDTSLNSSTSLNIINSLVEADLCALEIICPVCEANINLEDKFIIDCYSCEEEINISTLPILKINKTASLVKYFQNKYDDNSYENNANILLTFGMENGYLYYLFTDIVDSQTQQRDDADNYSSILEKLWVDLWPKIMHISKKANLPVFSKGDAVAWVFTNKDDILNSIGEIVSFINDEPITKLTVFASNISILNSNKRTFVRSLDKKWDLNTPSVTDFYRKVENTHNIWGDLSNYVVKYCLFDELAEFAANRKLKFLKNAVINDYSFNDKHENHYEGKCFVGYCDSDRLDIEQEPSHAR